jgi:uncharacterized Zn finger protein
VGYYGWYKPESAADKAKKNQKSLEKLRKTNPDISPIIISGNLIASKWWGKAWNKNLENYADFKNRISRGKAYVKSGAVLDLKISEGKVEAIVQGNSSKPYNVTISIDKLDKRDWEKVKQLCNRKIDTLETLLLGSFPKVFDEMFSNSKNGIFPSPKEIHFKCTCPDSARMCKHIAATLYGVGSKLDEDPILFFKLRDIDFQDLLKKSMEDKMQSMLKNADKKSERAIDDAEIFDLFGV